MKDKSVTDAVRWLEENLHCSLLTVDHWDADTSAIGVARPEDPSQLVYFRAGLTDSYFVELEIAPSAGSGLPYEVVGRHKEVDRAALLKIVREHLNLHESRM